jgi:hypothetical protein
MCSITTPQLGEIAAQRHQLLLDEHRLAVEQVDIRAGDLAVHQQQDAFALHGFQRGVGLAQVGHARIAVGGGPRRIELDGHHARLLGAADFIGWQVVGEVQASSTARKAMPAGTAERMRSR